METERDRRMKRGYLFADKWYDSEQFGIQSSRKTINSEERVGSQERIKSLTVKNAYNLTPINDFRSVLVKKINF